MLEQIIVHRHDWRANTQPNEWEILASPLLQERERPVQLNMLHSPPISYCVGGRPHGSVDAEIRSVQICLSGLLEQAGERTT